MWELDHTETWAPKKWCLWTVISEKTLESPLDCKEIQPVNPKGNQSWISIGRTDTSAEAPILWSSDVKNCLIGKDPDAGQDWRREVKARTEDEMVWWHQWLDGHEFEQSLGTGEGQRSLACCSPWGHKESGTIEQLNWTKFCPSSGAIFQSVPNFIPFPLGSRCADLEKARISNLVLIYTHLMGLASQWSSCYPSEMDSLSTIWAPQNQI